MAASLKKGFGKYFSQLELVEADASQFFRRAQCCVGASRPGDQDPQSG
jgi:hypothetical protein